MPSNSSGCQQTIIILMHFIQLAVRLAAQGNSTKATTLNSIYGKLSLLLVRANAHAFIARSISEATTMDLLGLESRLMHSHLK